VDETSAATPFFWNVPTRCVITAAPLASRMRAISCRSAGVSVAAPRGFPWRSTLFSRRLDRPDAGRCDVKKQRVLFLCTHNSARSQMAEGFLRAIAGDRFEAQSAGTERTAVHPLAIQVMAERGIDISQHTSKLYVGLMNEPWDYLITVCDEANERCPFVPGSVKRLHWSLEDPSRSSGSEQERLAVFRRVRDQIEVRLTDWIKTQ
jgi:arsenate reductase